VPQGTKLGPILFLVMINDLNPPCDTTKFVDDTTNSEIKPVIGPGRLQQSLNFISDWSTLNDLIINPIKTKHLAINFTMQKEASQTLSLGGSIISKVPHSKLLGLIISDKLTWDLHTSKSVSKASQRLHLLNTLKFSGFSVKDLKTVYITHVRSLTEYACEAWHPGLTQTLSHDIERVQIRALRIILPNNTYWEALDILELTTLEERRVDICRKTYNKMKDPKHPLHNLLPPIRINTHGLRHQKNRLPVATKTKRADGSFVNYSTSMFEE
jgi:hypothetical protein